MRKNSSCMWWRSRLAVYETPADPVSFRADTQHRAGGEDTASSQPIPCRSQSSYTLGASLSEWVLRRFSQGKKKLFRVSPWVLLLNDVLEGGRESFSLCHRCCFGEPLWFFILLSLFRSRSRHTASSGWGVGQEITWWIFKQTGGSLTVLPAGEGVYFYIFYKPFSV